MESIPKSLPGFEHVKRGWHNKFNAVSARLMPGEYYVTCQSEAVYTTLGSCVSACIRDRELGIGGMNHFMLPSTGAEDLSQWSDAARYGNFAMEHLINSILKQGGQRARLEVKLFGGGRIMSNMTDVGARNISFVNDYIKTERLKVVSSDLGDIYPRMVVYFPDTGRAMVKRLRSLHTNTIVEQEVQYIKSVESKPVAGDVELF